MAEPIYLPPGTYMISDGDGRPMVVTVGPEGLAVKAETATRLA